MGRNREAGSVDHSEIEPARHQPGRHVFGYLRVDYRVSGL